MAGRRRIEAAKQVHTAKSVEAVGYVRVSTLEQSDSGLGLEAQRRRITAYCEAQGYELVAMVADEGVSGKTLNRDGLREAVGMLRPGRILVALKLDRLTRGGARGLDELTEQVLATGAGWATVEGSYDTSSAMGRFMTRLVAEIAALEAAQTAERTVQALTVKRQNRERLGTTALGFVTVQGEDGRTRVLPDAGEQETVALARRLRAEGQSLRQIAAELTRQERKTKRGGRWAAETVAGLIEPRYLEQIAG
jgi:site-specific DNA recombinase